MSDAAPRRRRLLSFPGLLLQRRPTDVRDIPLRAAYRRPGRRGLIRIVLYILFAATLFAYGYGYGATAPFLMTPMLIPQAVLGALIIWCLPAGDYAPVRALSPLFFAFLAAIVLWPNYLAIALPGLPWLTLTRIFGVPLTIALLVCISVSKTFRKTLTDCLNADPLIWKAFVGLVACETLSLALSGQPVASLNRYVLAQTNWTAMFIVSAIIFLRPGTVERWAKLFFGACLVIALIGMWEFKLGYVPWAGHIPSFLKIEDDSVLRTLAGARRSATGIYRVQSTATTPLGLAEILGLSAPFALHFAIGRYPFWLRMVALAALPLLVMVILLTDSRLGVVSCLVGLMLYLLFWAILRWRQVKDSVFAPALVFGYPAIFTVMVAATFVVGKLRAKVWGNGSQSASTASRGTQWDMGIPKILTHPFGQGMGQSGSVLQFRSPSGVPTVDSYYLTVLLELGILGFILYFFIFLRASWTGVRTLVTGTVDQETLMLIPLSVCLVNFVIVKSVFSQDANHPLVFMMLGAIVALAYRSKMAAAATSVPPPPNRGRAGPRRR
jgi:O-antigen ligase